VEPDPLFMHFFLIFKIIFFKQPHLSQQHVLLDILTATGIEKKTAKKPKYCRLIILFIKLIITNSEQWQFLIYSNAS
jgi:hypothetical protein